MNTAGRFALCGGEFRMLLLPFQDMDVGSTGSHSATSTLLHNTDDEAAYHQVSEPSSVPSDTCSQVAIRVRG